MRLLRFARNDKEGGDVTNQTDEYSYLKRGIVRLTLIMGYICIAGSYSTE